MCAKLYSHFKRMQQVAASYVAKHPRTEKDDNAFIAFMLEALDGTNQREAEQAYEDERRDSRLDKQNSKS